MWAAPNIPAPRVVHDAEGHELSCCLDDGYDHSFDPKPFSAEAHRWGFADADDLMLGALCDEVIAELLAAKAAGRCTTNLVAELLALRIEMSDRAERGGAA